MPKLRLFQNQKWLSGSVLLISLSVLLFQNCGKNFEVMQDAQMQSLGLVGAEDPHIQFSGTQSLSNTDLTFNLHLNEVSSSPFISWSYTLDGFSTGCTSRIANAGAQFIVNCSKIGKLEIKASVWDGGTQIAVTPYSALLTAGAGGSGTTTSGLVVTFNIPAGTGSSPWNSPTTVIETYVGQTLTIRNNDSVTHQLHTGGRPCPHGNAIAAGASGNCVISQAYNYATDGAIYDHIAGSAARVYILAFDGAALYNQSCSSCHGALASSEMRLKTPAQITQALNTNTQMMNNPGLRGLTTKQIEAISFALGGVK